MGNEGAKIAVAIALIIGAIILFYLGITGEFSISYFVYFGLWTRFWFITFAVLIVIVFIAILIYG